MDLLDQKLQENAPRILEITTDKDLIFQSLQESPHVLVTEDGVRPNIKAEQTTIIIRDIPSATPVAEVLQLIMEANLSGVPFAATPIIKSEMNDTWFVHFSTREEALAINDSLKKTTFQGKQVKSRIKTDSIAKAYYSNNKPRRQYQPQAEDDRLIVISEGEQFVLPQPYPMQQIPPAAIPGSPGYYGYPTMPSNGGYLPPASPSQYLPPNYYGPNMGPWSGPQVPLPSPLNIQHAPGHNILSGSSSPLHPQQQLQQQQQQQQYQHQQYHYQQQQQQQRGGQHPNRYYNNNNAGSNYYNQNPNQQGGGGGGRYHRQSRGGGGGGYRHQDSYHGGNWNRLDRYNNGYHDGGGYNPNRSSAPPGGASGGVPVLQLSTSGSPLTGNSAASTPRVPHQTTMLTTIPPQQHQSQSQPTGGETVAVQSQPPPQSDPPPSREVTNPVDAVGNISDAGGPAVTSVSSGQEVTAGAPEVSTSLQIAQSGKVEVPLQIQVHEGGEGRPESYAQGDPVAGAQGEPVGAMQYVQHPVFTGYGPGHSHPQYAYVSPPGPQYYYGPQPGMQHVGPYYSPAPFHPQQQPMHGAPPPHQQHHQQQQSYRANHPRGEYPPDFRGGQHHGGGMSPYGYSPQYGRRGGGGGGGYHQQGGYAPNPPPSLPLLGNQMHRVVSDPLIPIDARQHEDAVTIDNTMNPTQFNHSNNRPRKDSDLRSVSSKVSIESMATDPFIMVLKEREGSSSKTTDSDSKTNQEANTVGTLQASISKSEADTAGVSPDEGSDDQQIGYSLEGSDVEVEKRPKAVGVLVVGTSGVKVEGNSGDKVGSAATAPAYRNKIDGAHQPMLSNNKYQNAPHSNSNSKGGNGSGSGHGRELQRAGSSGSNYSSGRERDPERRPYKGAGHKGGGGHHDRRSGDGGGGARRGKNAGHSTPAAPPAPAPPKYSLESDFPSLANEGISQETGAAAKVQAPGPSGGYAAALLRGSKEVVSSNDSKKISTLPQTPLNEENNTSPIATVAHGANVEVEDSRALGTKGNADQSTMHSVEEEEHQSEIPSASLLAGGSDAQDTHSTGESLVSGISADNSLNASAGSGSGSSSPHDLTVVPEVQESFVAQDDVKKSESGAGKLTSDMSTENNDLHEPAVGAVEDVVGMKDTAINTDKKREHVHSDTVKPSSNASGGGSDKAEHVEKREVTSAKGAAGWREQKSQQQPQHRNAGGSPEKVRGERRDGEASSNRRHSPNRRKHRGSNNKNSTEVNSVTEKTGGGGNPGHHHGHGAVSNKDSEGQGDDGNSANVDHSNNDGGVGTDNISNIHTQDSSSAGSTTTSVSTASNGGSSAGGAWGAGKKTFLEVLQSNK